MMLIKLLVILTWVFLKTGAAGILEAETSHLQSCPFNLLCRCSKQGPEVGMIYCEDVPLGDVPIAINNTKAFALNLRRNGLHRIEENIFHQTGLWKLDIRGNFLSSIPEMAFAGLERSLGELNLPSNRLQRIPRKALQNLGKLKILDLSDNQIVEISREDFVGLEDSLQILSLAGNYLATFQLETFSGFQRLERLNLKGNSILSVVPLSSGGMKLGQLILADNSLDRIPFHGIAQLRSLSTINLANNRISSTYDPFFEGHISIDSLILDNNTIGELPPFAFQNFKIINRTSLNGNNIMEVADDAFKDTKIRELAMADCSMVKIAPKAFRGLETSLHRLDLSFNNLSSLPENLFDKFDQLRVVVLNDNSLFFKSEEALGGHTLQTVNLVGEKMGQISFKQINGVRSLRTVGLKTMDERVSMDDFEGLGAALENLSLTKNKLKSISSNAFRHVPGLKSLDLTENKISQIEADAFIDVASSLTHLNMANGLAFGSLPSEPFRKLNAIRSIDFSNNRITSLPVDLFHSMKDLRTVNAQDNAIEKIPPHLFDSNHIPNLASVTLRFNFIGSIEAHAFTDLCELKALDLEDNKISKIYKNAFYNNGKLESIYLEGNLIQTIEPEAFHNLPKLETLNLAYNKLDKLSFDWFDQVGSLSAIKLDVSHNAIQQLLANRTDFPTYTSIRALDLGYNNISFISRNFFEPIRSSLTHLVLRHNQLRNISRDIYSDMENLLWLDLGSNVIQLVDSDAFANAKNLQILFLDNNEISEIYQDMLTRSSTLRVINLSHNKLRFLPDTLFKDTLLEILDVSHNQISKIPDGCLSRIATTLRHLDLSYNEITFTNTDQLKKMTNLVYLDLSHNSITTLTDKTFASLCRLTFLDLSSNPITAVVDHVFDSQVQSLVHLSMADIGRVNLSEFHLPELLSLNISRNKMEGLPSDFFTRYANLKELDVSHCELTVLQESPWSTASKLRALRLNGNELTIFTNGTLASMKSIEYLNIQDLPLQSLEEGCLFQMSNLRHLAISTYDRIKGLNILRLLENNQVLRHLDIEVESRLLDNQLRGKLSQKISSITISGEQLTAVSSSALQGVQSKSLTLALRNNGIKELTRDLFQNLGQVRWLQLELRRNTLSKVAEPSTTLYPGSGRNSVFLTSLYMSDNPWSCDCTVGWVEFWMRKWRQFLCSERCSNYQSIMRDLRLSSCRNRANNSLVTILKTELECGWSSSSSVTASWFHWTLIVAVGMTLFRQLTTM